MPCSDSPTLAPRRTGRWCSVGTAEELVLRDAMAGLASLRTVNGWEGLPQLLAGGVSALDLKRAGLVVAVAHLLPRSAASLTALDVRWAMRKRGAGKGEVLEGARDGVGLLRDRGL